MKKNLLKYFICAMFLVADPTALAQGSRKGPPKPPPMGRPPIYPELPIDGGLSLLLFGGTLLGAYHMKQKKPSN